MRAFCHAPISVQLRSGRQVVHVAHVLCFLSVKQPDAPATLRLAVCRVLPPPQRQGCVCGEAEAEVWKKRRAVGLDVLGSLLVTAFPPGRTGCSA